MFLEGIEELQKVKDRVLLALQALGKDNGDDKISGKKLDETLTCK